ncbi:Alpha/Beta hydrolase protein [Baffinella frigidus]|nr:Alpha/Beta hydrolase protein [Cryptophyta sp. CCMP2293]
MAKVASSSAFPREIYKTGVTGYTEEYLVAKARVGEHFLERPHRRKLCYFLDGDKSGEPLICLHGGGEGKYNFLQKQPIPGVLMISVDRMGYGASDLFEPVNVYTFAHVAEDIAALADHLGLDQFVVCGFSIGSSWGMSLALALPGRVRGLALFGAMADTGHPKMTKATIKEVGKPPAVLDPVTGSSPLPPHPQTPNPKPQRGPEVDYPRSFPNLSRMPELPI